jgi:hypothetical protein
VEFTCSFRASGGPQDSFSAAAGALSALRPQNAPAAFLESWRGLPKQNLPFSGKRAETLFLVGGFFRTRREAGLTYRSQSMGELDRALDRRRKLQAQLEGTDLMARIFRGLNTGRVSQLWFPEADPKLIRFFREFGTELVTGFKKPRA